MKLNSKEQNSPQSKMPKRETSESESENASNSRSESESEEPETVENKKNVSEYEQQRLRRIADNRARLKALGLPQMASSFMKALPGVKKKKGKEKVKENDDEEYRPENEEEEEGHGSSSSSEHDRVDSDVDAASGSRKRKVKNKGLKTKGRVSGKKHSDNSEYTNDDDEALMQAIALSLQDSAEASICFDKNVGNTSKGERKGNIQEDKGRKKNIKTFASRLQMTEDELILNFFQLDEAGKGSVTKRDLEKAALAHDFVWSDKELVDMIRCFDSDGDGKISLDDFRKIIVRCNMMKGSENS